MNQLLERLKKDFENPEARSAYADSVTNAFVSAQIKALRDERKLNQEKLAELIGTKQSGISRLERADYSAWKIGTLRKLAKAFGVRLRISFEEFGTLPDDVAGFKKNRLLPRRFEDDPAFSPDLRVPNFADQTVAQGLGQVPDLEAACRNLVMWSESFKAAVDSALQPWNAAVASAFAEQQRTLQQALETFRTVYDYSAVFAASTACTGVKAESPNVGAGSADQKLPPNITPAVTDIGKYRKRLKGHHRSRPPRSFSERHPKPLQGRRYA